MQYVFTMVLRVFFISSIGSKAITRNAAAEVSPSRKGITDWNPTEGKQR
jgi:hypothetical protein